MGLETDGVLSPRRRFISPVAVSTLICRDLRRRDVGQVGQLRLAATPTGIWATRPMWTTTTYRPRRTPRGRQIRRTAHSSTHKRHMQPLSLSFRRHREVETGDAPLPHPLQPPSHG